MLQRIRADMVRAPMGLTMPYQISPGVLTALTMGLGPMPCPGLPGETQRQAMSLLPVRPLALLLTGSGPDLPPGHACHAGVPYNIFVIKMSSESSAICM